jgi:hypothetical protein
MLTHIGPLRPRVCESLGELPDKDQAARNEEPDEQDTLRQGRLTRVVRNMRLE